MAHRLDSFPARRTQSRYPWDQLLDGSIWQLIRGEDFSGKPSSFRANAQTQAQKRGGRLNSQLTEVHGQEALVIQFRPR